MNAYARKIATDLVQAKTNYLAGNGTALTIIKEKSNTLAEFYPVHIAKEDNIFSPNTEKYLSVEEQEDMFTEFREFDRNMIHENIKLWLLAL